MTRYVNFLLQLEKVLEEKDLMIQELTIKENHLVVLYFKRKEVPVDTKEPSWFRLNIVLSDDNFDYKLSESIDDEMSFIPTKPDCFLFPNLTSHEFVRKDFKDFRNNKKLAQP